MKYTKAKEYDSDFDINLLQHCLDTLIDIKIPTNIRYQISLILGSLRNDKITSFLTKFLTRISREEFLEVYSMATMQTKKAEEFLKSNVNIKGIDNIFRELNQEVHKYCRWLISKRFLVFQMV